MKSSVVLCLRCKSIGSSVTASATETSSAVTGSSAMTILGFPANARAIPMHCFCPPDSCLDHLEDCLGHIVRSYINETLQYIVFNGLIRIRDDNRKFFNTSIVLDRTGNYFENDRTYKKTFLHGLEKKYISSGINDMLALETAWGKFGFLTCYDICFPQLVQELVYIKKVDALLVNAA